MRHLLLAIFLVLPMAAQVTVNETTSGVIAVDLSGVENDLRVDVTIHKDNLNDIRYTLTNVATGELVGSGTYDLTKLNSATHSIEVGPAGNPGSVSFSARINAEGNIAWSMTAAGDSASGVVIR